MHVIFVEPSFPGNQPRFAQGLAAAGARVTGVGEVPVDYLSPRVREALTAYEQVPSVVFEGAMLETVQRIQKEHGPVDRIEATVEAHMMPVARVREKCGIPGTSVQTTFLCRDKPAMKEFLREQGVPCAQSDGVSSPDEARAFAERVGFPLILKPPAGAGASGTVRVDDMDQLDDACVEYGVDKGRTAAIEEFIEGHEGFYDTLTIDGEVVHEFISHYYPGVLEAMRTRWISPYLVTTNRLDAEGYNEVKELGKKVIKALDIGTSATHMEWFYGPKGLKFSEIGCRPPGVQVWDLYSAANDMDLYEEWGHAIVHGKPSTKPSRRYSSGMINLRPDQDGTIAGYEGLEDIEQRFGDSIIDSHFPPPGARTAPVEGGYMVNGWMRLRHPDYDALREIMDTIGSTVRMRAE